MVWSTKSLPEYTAAPRLVMSMGWCRIFDLMRLKPGAWHDLIWIIFPWFLSVSSINRLLFIMKFDHEIWPVAFPATRLAHTINGTGSRERSGTLEANEKDCLIYYLIKNWMLHCIHCSDYQASTNKNLYKEANPGRCENSKAQYAPSIWQNHPSVSFTQTPLQQAEKDKWQSTFLQSISKLLLSWKLYTTPTNW